MKVIMTRDSVCAADDIDAPHTKIFTLPNDATADELAREAQRRLPLIVGGDATWSLVNGIPVAVMAQQWREPEILPRRAFDLAPRRPQDDAVTIHLNYHAQLDPEVVLKVLKELKFTP